MPVYEYRCTACNHQFELQQKFSEPPADHCPDCGGAVRKMVSASAFSLKGGGWYGDGYKMAVETPKTEAAGAGGTEATAGSAQTDPATKETAPASSPVQSKSETKSAPAEKPAATVAAKAEPA
jgi:putative FmdB family regulatory protein